MRMTALFLTVLIGMLVAWSAAAEGAIVFYVSNPTGNSLDWKSAAQGICDPINTAVNFDGLPTGTFTSSSFYSPSCGVTLAVTFSKTSGAVGQISNNAGPGGTDSTSPLSAGEGTHAASNYLYLQPAKGMGMSPNTSATLTVTFAKPVAAFGIETIDLNRTSGGSDSLVLTAFDSLGHSLGTANAASYNFQANKCYFMGMLSTADDIASVTCTVNNSKSGGMSTADAVGFDNLSFATAPDPATLLLLGLGATTWMARGLSRRKVHVDCK